MATIKPELKQILDKYGINQNDKSQLWDCHGTLVLYHKAYEIIAAKENIVFDAPVVIEGNAKDKIVSLLVTGRMGDRSEWSFGEASSANLKSTYPYAMAEKRAKDRVIAKLVGLAQYVYSEDEADDFKNAKPAPEPEIVPVSGEEFLLLQDGIRNSKTTEELAAARQKVASASVRLSPEQLKTLSKERDNKNTELAGVKPKELETA